MNNQTQITLYQIDRSRKTVSFFTCSDIDEDIQKSCTENGTAKIYTFDEILNQLEDFRDSFFKFEELIINLIQNISKGRDVNESMLQSVEEFRSTYIHNFFAVYYSDTLIQQYRQGRERINSLIGSIRNAATQNKYTQQQKDSLSETFAEIRKAINDEWNFDFNTNKETHLIRKSNDLIIIRGENINEILNVADDSLLNFYFDFSHAVKRLGLTVLRCDYCSRHFLGTKDSVCCEKTSCKATYAKLKRHTYENQTYVHERKAFKGYIRTKRSLLKSAVHGDYEIMQKFNDMANSFYAPVDELLVEYMDNNKPIDQTFNDLYQAQEKKLLAFMHELIAEWKMRQGL